MKRLLICILLAVGAASSIASWCAETPRTLLFEAVAGEGASQDLARSVTRGLRDYLRSVKRTEVEVFDRTSPTVERAILEKRLTADQVASYASNQDRITVGSILGFQYIGGSEITMKDDTLTVKLWISGAGGKKSENWQTEKSAKARGGSNRVENAVQTAASAAVMDIAPKAFAKTPELPDEPAEVQTTSLPPLTEPPTGQGPTVDDTLKQARESMQKGDIALAIDQYSKAVNLDPGNGAIRLELAEAYLKKGLLLEAYDELTRAQAAGADIAKVQDLGQRIAQAAPRDSDDGTPPPPRPAAGNTRVRPGSKPSTGPDKLSGPAAAKLGEGDDLWAKNQIPQAVEAYKQAIALSPRDWHGIERLTFVLAAVGKFQDAKVALTELKRVNPDPSPGVLNKRYSLLHTAVDKRMSMLIGQYQSGYSSYQLQRTSREKLYNSVQDASAAFQDMAGFADAMQTPAEKSKLNLRRSLACGLASQAADAMMDYLETDDHKALDNAEAFMTEVQGELKSIGDLESAPPSRSSGTPLERQLPGADEGNTSP